MGGNGTLIRAKGRSEAGAALIMVIWVMLALTVILSEFIFSTRVSLNAARNYRMESAGYYLALGAFYLALEEISGDYDYLLPGDDAGVIFVRDGEEPEDLTSPQRSGKLSGVGDYAYRIVDEESKFNLKDNGRKELVRFFRASGHSLGTERDTLVDSILDWQDPNDLHRLNGAEDDYYQSLTPPYHAKNAKFDSAEELLLVRGMSTRLFYGSARRKKGRVADMVTVYGSSVNRNTAPPEVLKGVLGNDEAQEVIDARESSPVTGSRGRSSYFTIIAEGSPDGAVTPRRIKAVIRRTEDKKKGTGTAVLHWNDHYMDPYRTAADAEG